jgi:hypothetical protein
VAARLPGRSLIAGAALAALLAAASEGAEERRVALAIGMSAYAGGPVGGVAADVSTMKNSLEKLGFVVTPVTDLGHDAFQAKFKQFVAANREAELVAVFYAGHGVEMEDASWILPIDVELGSVPSIRAKGINLDGLLEQLSELTATKLLMLSACRNAATAPSDGQWAPGFARASKPPAETVILYSVPSGRKSADPPNGQASLFTQQLARILRWPGIPILEAFRRTVDVVNRYEFHPWMEGSLSRDLRLSPPAEVIVRIDDADDDAIVRINGRDRLSYLMDGNNDVRVELEPGTNEVEISVWNKRSFTTELLSHRMEGWRYAARILPIGGSNALWSRKDGEDVPGSTRRFGRLFPVASVRLDVNPEGGAVTVGSTATLWNTTVATCADVPAANRDWKAGLDRCRNDSAAQGSVDCPERYLAVAPECFLAGGRQCLMKKAAAAAAAGNATKAYNLALLCHCGDDDARAGLTLCATGDQVNGYMKALTR